MIQILLLRKLFTGGYTLFDIHRLKSTIDSPFQCGHLYPWSTYDLVHELIGKMSYGRNGYSVLDDQAIYLCTRPQLVRKYIGSCRQSLRVGAAPFFQLVAPASLNKTNLQLHSNATQIKLILCDRHQRVALISWQVCLGDGSWYCSAERFPDPKLHGNCGRKIVFLKLEWQCRLLLTNEHRSSKSVFGPHASFRATYNARARRNDTWLIPTYEARILS